MPKNKRTTGNQVRVGDISGLSGNMNVAGGHITAQQTVTASNAAEIKQLFDQLYITIESRAETPPKDKEGLKAEVEEIQTTVTAAIEQKKEVSESFLLRRFQSIARMAPDILDVVVAALANPALGIGVAVKKIAEKAKEETGAA